MSNRQNFGARKTLLLTATGAAAIAGLAGAAQASPIWEYKFNETGVGAANTGTDATAMLTEQVVYSGNTDMHGAPGSGVSGQAGDRSLDASGANKYGNYGGTQGGYAWYKATTSNVSAINNLKSFTVSTWVKLNIPLTDYASLTGSFAGRVPFVISAGGNGSGIGLKFANTSGDNTVQVSVNGIANNALVDIESAMPLAATGKWYFMAYSYDGTQTANNVNVYIGSDTAAASFLGTATINQGTMTVGSDFYLGFDSDWNPTMLGGVQYDNVRIDGSTADASGVLSLADLQARQAGDVGVVPEPATLALAGLGGLLILGRRQRRTGWKLSTT